MTFSTQPKNVSNNTQDYQPPKSNPQKKSPRDFSEYSDSIDRSENWKKRSLADKKDSEVKLENPLNSELDSNPVIASVLPIENVAHELRLHHDLAFENAESVPEVSVAEEVPLQVPADRYVKHAPPKSETLPEVLATVDPLVSKSLTDSEQSPLSSALETSVTESNKELLSSDASQDFLDGDSPKPGVELRGQVNEQINPQVKSDLASSSLEALKFSPTVDAAKQVTETVTDGLVQQVKYAEEGTSKSLVLQLHPAELGQVTLQVDWENDTLKAKILANEFAASEILNQQKPQLIAALAEQGLDFDSLDVAYQDTPQEQQPDSGSETSLPLSSAEPDLEVTEQAAVSGHVESVINIVV